MTLGGELRALKNHMNNSKSEAQGSRCYEQLRGVDEMSYFRSDIPNKGELKIKTKSSVLTWS